MATPRTDDDELPALPPLDGDVDDGPAAPTDDGVDEEEETVGLDATTGEEELDAELDGADEEGESFLEGSEPGAVDDGDDDDLAAGEDERGWTTFAETEAAPEEDLGGADAEALATTDRGEEGLVDEEPVRGTEADDADLPRRDAPLDGPEPKEHEELELAALLPAHLRHEDAAERPHATTDAPAPRTVGGPPPLPTSTTAAQRDAALPPRLPASMMSLTWLDDAGVEGARRAAGADAIVATRPLGPAFTIEGTDARLVVASETALSVLVPVASDVEIWATVPGASGEAGARAFVLVRRDARGVLRTVADVGVPVLALFVRDGTAWIATARGVLRVVVRG